MRPWTYGDEGKEQIAGDRKTSWECGKGRWTMQRPAEGLHLPHPLEVRSESMSALRGQETEMGKGMWATDNTFTLAWEPASHRARTTFTDGNGNEKAVKRGDTWRSNCTPQQLGSNAGSRQDGVLQHVCMRCTETYWP
jgi:hypothetical protein